jgi:hypothetical protein
MVSSAIEGFVTGFAGTLAEGVRERNAEARDYFNKQVEYARTTGLQNRQRVQQAVDANLSIAQQLEQVGVPRELIMAQVNQNPNGLADFYKAVEDLRQSSSEPITPEGWKGMFDVGGSFIAPNEDLATFIRRSLDPIQQAVNTPGFKEDPKGTLMSRLLGFGAMDAARARLDETVIADGLTAGELIRYGDNVVPQRVGGEAVVTLNYDNVPRKDERLNLVELERAQTAIADIAKPLITALQGTEGVVQGQDATAIRDEIVRQFMELPVEGVSEEDVRRLAEIHLRKEGLTISEVAPAPEDLTGGPEGDVEGLPADQTSEGSQVASPPPVEPPTASDEPLSPEERMAAEAAYGFTGIVDNGDGTALVTLPDGTARRYKVADVRELLRRFETQ